MLKRVILISFVLVFAAGVAAVAAQDHSLQTFIDQDYGPMGYYNDSRLNNFDVAAPVVIFPTTESILKLDAAGNRMWDDDGFLLYEEVSTGLEFWMVDRETDGAWKALEVSNAQLADLAAGAIPAISEHGISVQYNDGWMWVSCPDFDGTNYTFAWEGI